MSDRNTDDNLSSIDDFDENGTTPPKDARLPRKRRRWPYVVLALLLLIALAPNLVGWTGLHQTAIDYATKNFEGKIKVQSLSAGWFQPVQLKGVSIEGIDGQTLLDAESIQTSSSLFHFLTKDNFGTIDVYRPEVLLSLRPDGSNLEDALASLTKLAGNSQEPSSDPQSAIQLPSALINIHSGVARVATTTSLTQWSLEEINGFVRSGATEAPLLLSLTTRVTPESQDAEGNSILEMPGHLTLAGQIDAGQSQLTFESAEVAIETQQFPLSTLGPALERFIGPTATAGRLKGKMQAYYNGVEQSVALKMERMDGEMLAMASPNLLGDDQLQIQVVGAEGEIQLTPNLIFAKMFSVESELGKLNANGNFDVQQLTQLAQQGRLLDSPFQMDGSIDLARVIKMLPSTLKLHQDLDVTSGTVSFQVNSHAPDPASNLARRLVINVDTANLRAMRAGKEIVWSKPIRIVGTVSEQNGQLAIEDLTCESEFLNLNGSGNLASGSFKANGNLGILTERIGQFVDLQETRIGGVLEGQFGWQVPTEATSTVGLNPNPVQIGGNFRIQQPLIELPAVPRWQPSELNVKFSGEGMTRLRDQPLVGTVIKENHQPSDNGYALQLNQGGIQVDIGNERAVATLSKPIEDVLAFDESQQWLAACQITGGLDRWLAHTKNFIDLGPIQARGKMNLVSDVVVSGKKVEFSSAQYRVDELGFAGYGMTVSEPSVEGTATGDFTLANGELLFRDITVIATSLSARGRDVRLSYPDNLHVNGDVAYRANVNRVADWYALSPDADSLFFFGEAEGNVRLVTNDVGIEIQSDSTIKDFVAANQTPVVGQPTGPIVQASNPQRQWTAIWQDPKLRLFGGITVGHDFESLKFSNTQIQSESLVAIVDGSAKDIYDQMIVDVQGTWKPDWSKINSLVSFYSGELLQFEGTSTQSFNVRGPLFAKQGNLANPSIVAQPVPWISNEMSAAANFGWDRGSVLGLPVGESQFEVQLNQGLAKVTTDGIPFSGGLIKFAPVVDLQGTQPVVKMDWTRLVDNVELKPDTARQWLRYVAPLAADATSAQGNFTVDIGEATIPVFDPTQMQARGAVKLSNVVIGAGPIAEQLIGSIKQVRQLLKPDATDRDLKTWLKMSEQTIPIVVRDGRVFHDKVDFVHNDLTVRTSGSVGFDQSLQMVAQIPIADDWIAGKSYLAGLKGQSLSIPIGGTVTAPKLDKSAIEQLSRDLVKQATTGAINNAVEEKLTPKINEFQQKFNDKLNGQLNKLQQDFNKKLGIGSEGGEGGATLLPNPKNLLPGLIPKLGDSPFAPKK